MTKPDRDDALVVEPGSPTINVAGMRLSSSDIIKLALACLVAAVSWGMFQSKMNAVTERLDKRDSQDTMYLRADVQTARDEVILTQLRAVRDQLDRIQRLLDREEQNSAKR